MFKDIENFLNGLFKEVEELGINTNLIIDHIAYSASSTKEYESLRPIFTKKGKLAKEAVVDKRRVVIIKLDEPIRWQSHLIDAVELIEPILGEKKKSEWEHAEFFIEDFDEILSKYPNLNWDKKAKDRKEFARIKLSLPSGKVIKFLTLPIMEEL